MPSAILCSLSPLISRNHSSILSDWRRTVFYEIFDTQVPSISTGSLVSLAVLSLVFAATDTANCQALISFGLVRSKTLRAAPADTRPRTPLISFCTVQLWNLCTARSLATLCLSMTTGPGPGKFPGFWGSMVFRHAPIPRKGSGRNNNNNNNMKTNVLLVINCFIIILI